MSDCRTHFITLATVKEITPIGRNVDDRKLKPTFNVAHDVLRKILGITMYDDFIVKIEGATLNVDEQALIDDFICPFLSWETYHRAIPDLHSSVTKTGIHTKSGDEYDSIPADTIKIKSNQAQSISKDYQDMLIRHLEVDDNDKFPLFDNVTIEDQRVRRTYKAGIATGNTRRFRTNLDQFNEREL